MESHAQTPQLAPSRGRLLPVLINLGLPPFFNLGLLRSFLGSRSDLSLDALSRAQNLALEVEGAALRRVVRVKESPEALHDLLRIGLSRARRLDVQDLARLVEGHPRRQVRPAGAVLPAGRARILARCRRLLVRFGEGASEDSTADDHDLGDDSVGLFAKKPGVSDGGAPANGTGGIYHESDAKGAVLTIVAMGKNSSPCWPPGETRQVCFWR